MKLDILAHRIIEYIESRPEDMIQIRDILQGLKETFPKCDFKFHVSKGKHRLSATCNFCTYWFDILDDDYREVKYLTYEYLR